MIVFLYITNSWKPVTKRVTNSDDQIIVNKSDFKV